jgi:hypothetical protein
MFSETVSRCGAAATLRVNILPVVFADEIEKDVVYSLPYGDVFGRGEAAARSS